MVYEGTSKVDVEVDHTPLRWKGGAREDKADQRSRLLRVPPAPHGVWCREQQDCRS